MWNPTWYPVLHHIQGPVTLPMQHYVYVGGPWNSTPGGAGGSEPTLFMDSTSIFHLHVWATSCRTGQCIMGPWGWWIKTKKSKSRALLKFHCAPAIREKESERERQREAHAKGASGLVCLWVGGGRPYSQVLHKQGAYTLQSYFYLFLESTRGRPTLAEPEKWEKLLFSREKVACWAWTCALPGSQMGSIFFQEEETLKRMGRFWMYNHIFIMVSH